MEISEVELSGALNEELTKSKQRISDHGEVFTSSWMVEDMLNLVKTESERIDSRFLEPACNEIKKLLYIENFGQVDAIDRFNQVNQTIWRNFAHPAAICI